MTLALGPQGLMSLHGSGGGPAALQTLTLSNTSFSQDTVPTTTIATIGGKTSGSTIEVIGGNGKLVLNSNWTLLLKGLIGPAAGTFDITLREIHPTLGTKDTVFTITVTALTALDPMTASQTPAAIWSLRKVNSAYAGNCLTVRHNGNLTVNVGFSGTDINAAALQGVGDGISFRMTVWNDQMGVTNRNFTTSTGPYLTFAGNFGTLVNVPTPAAGGSGYVIGDVLNVSGGILADVGGIGAQLTVASVSGGAVTAVTVSRAGKYRYSPSGTNGTTAIATTAATGTGTGATFPIVLTPDAGNTYTAANCYVTSDVLGGTNMVTVDTFLNIGGTNNLSAFVIMSRQGYGSGSSPLPRPGSASTSVGISVALGYGTLVGNKLLTSCSNLGNGQNDATSYSINRDSLGRSAAPYDQPEWLALEEAAPSATAGFINVWFNQTGATITGGGDTRWHYVGREHGVAAAASQRVVLGASGNSTLPHNGGLREIVIFNPATPITDVEAQRIAIWQNQWSVVTQATVWANRYFVVGLGQSNINGQFSANTSGDNTGGTDSITRRFIPKMAEAIGVNSERILAGYSNRTMRGGTALLKRPMPGDPTTDFYFWDEDTSTPGNLWTGVDGSSVGNIKGYLDAIKYMKYKRVVIVYAQGEEDAASAMTGDPRRLQWAQQSYSYPDYVRTYIGQPEAPIVYQPLARYDAGRVNSNYMRRLQASYLSQQFNCFLAPDTGHLSRGTGANYIAHLGTMAVAANGGFDSTTGGAEDGYQRAAWQNAKAAAHALHIAQGKDLSLSDNWRGPELSAAVQSGASTIDITVSYPYGCGGSDISTVSGQYGGFTVYNASNVAQTISSVSKVNASTMRITLSGSVPVGWSIVYEPNYASGSAEGANVRNQLVDNNSELNLPVASSAILTA